jgi:hypothetical protein
MAHALLILLELAGHLLDKLFGPKFSDAEKKRRDEERRREGQKSFRIAIAIIATVSLLMFLAFYFGFLEL